MDAANVGRPDAGQAEESALSDRDREILEFERHWWKYAGAKETAVREKFDMSSTRYYQVLNALIDRPEALAVDPMLVKRLRRLRSARQRARSARRLGIGGAQGDRLLAQHVLARFERGGDVLDVQGVGRGDVDRVDRLVGQQLLIRAVRRREAALAREGGRPSL